MTTTLDRLRELVFIAIQEASGAEVAPLLASGNDANLLSTNENLRAFANEGAKLLARYAVPLRGRYTGSILAGEFTARFADTDGAALLSLVESPPGAPCASDVLGVPFAAWAAGYTEGTYLDPITTPVIGLRPCRPESLERWRNVNIPGGLVLDPELTAPKYWGLFPDLGVAVSPVSSRSIFLVLDCLALPVSIDEADAESARWEWLPASGERLLVCHMAARLCESRRDDPTLFPRAADFWAEWWQGVATLRASVPLDVAALLWRLPEPKKAVKVHA